MLLSFRPVVLSCTFKPQRPIASRSFCGTLANKKQDELNADFTQKLTEGQPFTIGRKNVPQSDFLIDDEILSRQHVKIILTTRNTAIVQDLGSTNGSKIRTASGKIFSIAKTQAHHPFSPGDTLLIGEQQLTWLEQAPKVQEQPQNGIPPTIILPALPSVAAHGNGFRLDDLTPVRPMPAVSAYSSSSGFLRPMGKIAELKLFEGNTGTLTKLSPQADEIVRSHLFQGIQLLKTGQYDNALRHFSHRAVAEQAGFTFSQGPCQMVNTGSLNDVFRIITQQARLSSYRADKTQITVAQIYAKLQTGHLPSAEEQAAITEILYSAALVSAEEWLHALQHIRQQALSLKGSAYAAQHGLPYDIEEDVACVLAEQGLTLPSNFWAGYSRKHYQDLRWLK